MSNKVFIGVGHGGSDPGAVANNLKEKDITLQIALETKRILVNHNVNVLMSREKDQNDTVEMEVAKENAFNSDLAVDIHINAGGGDGAEVFHHSLGGRSKVLATNINNQIIKIGQNSRGIKTRISEKTGKDYYMFIRETKGSAVIVECAFIDNLNDIKIVDEAHEQKVFGKAIAMGILETLNIKYNEGANTPIESTDSNCIYRVISGSYKDKQNAENQVKRLKELGVDSFIEKQLI